MKRLFLLPLLLLSVSACNLLQVKIRPDPFYSVLLKENADNAAALYAQGHRFVEQGRFKEALPYFERLTRLEPGNIQAWFNLGRCRYEARQFDRARGAFEKADKLHSSEATLLALAAATLMSGNAEEASHLARQSEARYGASAPQLQIRGDIAYFNGNASEALQYYRQSLEKNPKQPEIQKRVKDLEAFLNTSQ